MEQSKYAKELTQFIEEVIKVKESYDTAKEGILEEYEVRKLVLKEVDERFQQIQEAVNRGEETHAALMNVESDHKRVKETLNEVGQKLDEINKHMLVRLDKIILKLNDMNQKYREEIKLEKKKLNYQLKKAKFDYLKQLIDAKKEFANSSKQLKKAYKKLSKEENYLQELFKELGFESMIVTKDSLEVPSSSVMEVMDAAGAVVTSEELLEALESGKISSELEKELTEATGQGLL